MTTFTSSSLQAGERQFGLVVDDIGDTEEIVVKPLQRQLKGLGVYSGATIMGDGKVALILDVLGLAQRSGVVDEERQRHRPERAEAVSGEQRVPLLLVEATDGSRLAVPLEQVARLEEFPAAALERVGPRTVVQYRGNILPVVDVGGVLRGGKGRPRPAGDSVAVVVCAGPVGLVVGRIADIVEEAVTSPAAATREGVRFSAAVQGRVTEFLDVAAVLRRAAAGGVT